MASITLKALPSSLHRALKSRAARHKRSLNSEVIALLETGVAAGRPVNVEAMLERARKLRAQIDKFKREGRE
jgi:plasmid stability protein